MKRMIMILMLLLAVGFSMSTQASDDAQVKKDLQAVLALKGIACGEIATLKNLAENDYLVQCSNGKRYRVHIDANDNVVVEERAAG